METIESIVCSFLNNSWLIYLAMHFLLGLMVYWLRLGLKDQISTVKCLRIDNVWWEMWIKFYLLYTLSIVNFFFLHC